jgi:hypothetical protein
MQRLTTLLNFRDCTPKRTDRRAIELLMRDHKRGAFLLLGSETPDKKIKPKSNNCQPRVSHTQCVRHVSIISRSNFLFIASLAHLRRQISQSISRIAFGAFSDTTSNDYKGFVFLLLVIVN